jgi:hypothetical protein
MLTELSHLPVKIDSSNITIYSPFLFTFAGMFDQRCLEHSEEMENNTRLFLKNYKALNKKVKTFGELYIIQTSLPMLASPRCQRLHCH